MSKANTSISAMNDAFRTALESLGIVGCVTIHEGGSASRFWIGKPGGDDKEIVIRISDYHVGPDVRTLDDDFDRKFPC